MPFTPAHVAAVLPLVGRERPRWVVPAALVVGSMVPDVLYFVPIGDYRAVSHSLRGLVTLDLLLGLVLTGLWRLVAAPVLRDLSPGTARARLRPPHPLSQAEWLWSVPSVLLGGLTHLVWDSFTHGDGWAVHRWPQVLERELVAGMSTFSAAQYVSSVVGVAIALVWGLRTVAATPAVHGTPRRATAPERRGAWAILLGLPVVAAALFVAAAAAAGQPVLMLLYVAAVRGISAFGLAAAVVALWWHLVVSRRPALTGAPVG